MFNLPEKITVWNEIANDGHGGKTFSAPVVYPSRHALTQKKFTDKNGDERMSTAVAYSEGADLGIDSWVFFGVSSDPSPPSEANDVRSISEIPSAIDMKKVWFS